MKSSHSSRVMMLVFAAPLLLARAALAEGVSPPSGPSAELLSSEVRRRVTDDVKKFLEERCPQQCDVGEVTVKAGHRKPPVGATPGFEELAPDVKDFVVERVDVNLLLDKRLTNDFRTGLRTIVAKKLDAQGMANSIHEQLIHFPTPQEIPDRPPQAQPAPAPAPQPRVDDKKPEPAPQTVYAAPPERSAWDRFLDQLPLLLGLLLCGAVVWFTLRQYQRILEARTDARKDADVADLKEQAAVRAGTSPSLLVAQRELDARTDGVRAKLVGPRAGTLARAVMRDLLHTGAPADAALAVVVLGPSVLDGVRGDPECRAGLSAVDDYLAQRAPDDTADARRRLVGDLERRVLRVQVAHGEEPVDTAFSYLRDVSPVLFTRLLADEPPETQAIVLRQAPPALTQAFVERQGPAVRERLVRPLLDTAAVDQAQVRAVAESFRDKLGRTLLLERAEGQGDPIGDLLQAAPPAERVRLLKSLRSDPEALRRALSSFVADETLNTLDGDLLATAMGRLDVGTAALFARSLDDVGRKRLLSSLPTVAAHAIAEEAEVIVGSPMRRAAARRAAIDAIRHAAEARGLDLAELNWRSLSASSATPNGAGTLGSEGAVS